MKILFFIILFFFLFEKLLKFLEEFLKSYPYIIDFIIGFIGVFTLGLILSIYEKRNNEKKKLLKFENLIKENEKKHELIKKNFIKKSFFNANYTDSLSDEDKDLILKLISVNHKTFWELSKVYKKVLNEYKSSKKDKQKIFRLRDDLYYGILEILLNEDSLVANLSLDLLYFIEKLLKDEVSNYDRIKYKIKEFVDLHIKTLSNKRQKYIKVDDYGIIDDYRWREELLYFFRQVIKLNDLDKDYLISEYSDFINELIDEYDKNHKNDIEYENTMSGHEYEYFCAKLLSNNGWNTQVTQGSGDQGVDIMAKKGNKKVAIQCKKHQKPVGNKAVQEIYTGKNHYEADYAVVVASNGFTNSAKELAKTTNTILIHHNDLVDLDSFL